MKSTKAVFKLYAICPYCETQNGLVSLPSIERAYLCGTGDAPTTKRCWKCAEEFGIKPARSNPDPHYRSESEKMIGAKTKEELEE